MSRGLRNNNPGNIRISNIRFKGEIHPSTDESFKQFESMAYGYRAMIKILKYYYNHYNLRTVEQMIHRWAPTIENNTDAYILCVCREIGLPTNGEVYVDDEELMCNLVAAMSRVENGVKADKEIIKEAWEII